MERHTFGDPEQYRTLDYLTEKIAQMDDKQRQYMSSLIHDINSTIRNANRIEDQKFRDHVLDLIHKDLKDRIDAHVKNRYQDKVTTHLKNFLHTKVRRSKIRSSLVERLREFEDAIKESNK